MPGYSGTPLAKKLGIKDDFRAALLHVPDDVKTEHRRLTIPGDRHLVRWRASQAALDLLRRRLL